MPLQCQYGCVGGRKKKKEKKGSKGNKTRKGRCDLGMGHMRLN